MHELTFTNLGLLQRDVAEKHGIDATSIHNWERQRTTPEIRFIALIIDFLGYDPFPQPKSFPEQLKTNRLKMGLSQRKMAAQLGIDPGALGMGKWEA